jgi:hypothetical protein
LNDGAMSKGHPYKVLIVEDQMERFKVSPEAAFAADRAKGDESEPYLELAEVASNYDTAIQYLKKAPMLPDAIVVDDYLAEGQAPQSRSIQIMVQLFERCEREGIPPAERPRAVLWTSTDDPNLAYTFCVVGGLQFRDKKRDIDGQRLPVDAIWAALAGHRWCPDPYPSGLASPARRAALPWLEEGLPQKTIPAEPGLEVKVSEDTIRGALKEIRDMPRTPPEYPVNWNMGIRAAKRNGWVWVPRDRHNLIPNNAPLPLVIDPAIHAKGLPPYGPLPARIT